MDYDLKFQMNASDFGKIEPVALGRYHRILVLCSSGPLLGIGLSYILHGESPIFGMFLTLAATATLFDRWLIFPIWLAMGGNDACVRIDGKTLTSSLGAKSYGCLLYTSPSPRDLSTSRMPSSA